MEPFLCTKAEWHEFDENCPYKYQETLWVKKFQLKENTGREVWNCGTEDCILDQVTLAFVEPRASKPPASKPPASKPRASKPPASKPPASKPGEARTRPNCPFCKEPMQLVGYVKFERYCDVMKKYE